MHHSLSQQYVDITGEVIDTYIRGIPCQIRIDHFKVVQGSYDPNAPSSADYYGYSEIEFTVLDRKGYPAAWLERKMDAYLEEKIQLEILQYAEIN